MKSRDQRIDCDRPRLLSVLWIFVLLNMVYADILSLMDPASPLRLVMAGTAHLPVGLLFCALFLETSIAMALLSSLLPRRFNRPANIAFACLNIPAVILGGRGTYYHFFAAVETVALLAILVVAAKWPDHDPSLSELGR